MEIVKQLEKYQQIKPIIEDSIFNNSNFRFNNSNIVIDDNMNRFNDDLVKNFTSVNNSGNGNDSSIFNDDNFDDNFDDKRDNFLSYGIKISKIGVAVNLMLLFSLFLNM
jgi:hypothetical protein